MRAGTNFEHGGASALRYRVSDHVGGTTIKYLRDAAGNGMGTTIKYLRRAASAAACNGLCTTIKCLCGAAGYRSGHHD
jgi:hypothetical protein